MAAPQVHSDSVVSYAIVSHQIRRDLHNPLRFFETLKPIHFYYEAPYGDMGGDEMQDAYRYSNPADLLLKLRKIRPQIVQGGEPFVRRLIPYAWSVLAYSGFGRRPYVVPSLDNIPVQQKYGGAWAAAVRMSIFTYVRQARLSIAVNKGAEDNLRWAGAPPDRIARFMYGTWGVDTSEFSAEGPRAELPGTGAVLMFLGRVERAKGVFDLLEALPEVLAHVPARLVVLGDGPDAGELRRAAAAAGLQDRVHLMGTVMNKDVPRYLRAADLLVAPSRTTRKWAEQVGMSAVQALACGVPVVSTTSGSIAEFIDDGVTGVLVPEGAPAQLADAIVRLLTDETAFTDFRRRARIEAVRRFDARTNIRVAERRILEACGFAP